MVDIWWLATETYMAGVAGGTHHTGMLSCLGPNFANDFENKKKNSQSFEIKWIFAHIKLKSTVRETLFVSFSSQTSFFLTL